MKEDGKLRSSWFYPLTCNILAQLICPISYEDNYNAWGIIEQEIQENLPLKDVSWKSHVSSNPVSVSSLPLRFLPSSATLFKDTDHPFRWFLAPYVSIYVISGETMDAYKTSRPKIKSWIDAFIGLKRYVCKCCSLI